MSDFLTDYGVVLALACAAAALVYGAVTSRALLALSPGNETMRGISAAVQEGARRLPQSPVPDDRHRGGRAHGGSGVHPGRLGGRRLRDRRRGLSGRGLHRHERLGAGQCARGRGGPRRRSARAVGRLPQRRGHRPAGGRPGADRRRRLLRHPDLVLGPGAQGGDRRSDRPRLRRFADLRVRPPGRRHLHQGRRRGRRPGGQDRGRHPRGRPAQPGGDRRQRGRQRRRLRRHGRRPVRDLRRHRGRRDAAGRADLRRRGRHAGGCLPAGAGRASRSSPRSSARSPCARAPATSSARCTRD